MKRITLLAAAGVLVATPAVGAWAAFASTDDSPARHSVDLRVDDRAHHQRHGADDRPGHVRHSGEAEPGDDHGRHHGHGHDD
jgi:hypothetical protein